MRNSRFEVEMVFQDTLERLADAITTVDRRVSMMLAGQAMIGVAVIINFVCDWLKSR